MYGPRKTATLTVASAATVSAVFELGDHKFSKMAVKTTSMSTNAELTILGCDTVSGTYTPILERVNTAPVQYQTITIATTTSGNWLVCDVPPMNYMQFLASATVTGGGSVVVVFGQN